MEARNPYAAPHTNVTPAERAEDYGEIKIFSASGRIGRIRYIGYSFGLTMLIWIVIGIAAGIGALVDPALLIGVGAIGYIALIVVQFLLSIQRSHDMNVTGWLSLIWLVPLGVLVFWFAPGSRGSNDYGRPPPPNGAGVIILTCLMPIFIIGILAAISIPAYQDYTIRAQVSEGLSMTAPVKAAVADAFARVGAAPADRTDAGLSDAATDTGGKYVESVDVRRGTILVTYGSNANSVIAGTVLALQPYVMDDETVVWRCGAAAPPVGAVAMDGSARSSDAATAIEPRYLPSACRP